MKHSKKRLRNLVEKYSDNTATRHEFDELLEAVHDSRQEQNINTVLKEKWNSTKPATRRRNPYKWYSGVAAAIALALATALFVREFTATQKQMPGTENAAAASTITKLVLSDGSSVELREGGRLIQLSDFDGKRREVMLEGEAYFDIAPNPQKPFIIHTDKMKTTVLGTAFSIKAMPGEQLITLTVTHGKVRVEDDTHLLAVLDADKQLTYNKATSSAEAKTVNAEKETDWRTKEFIFKNKPFELIAQVLANTHSVTIVFESEALKHQLITASIDGDEPVEKVLEMLCTSQHAYFVFENGRYKIRPMEGTR